MQNKKGLVPALVIPFAIGIIALILVGAFIFSGTLRMILIGVGIFAGVIYLLGTIKSDKVKIISVIILIGVGILFASGVIQQQITEKFVKPQWARLECAPTDAYEGIYTNKWLDQEQEFRCDAFTEECRFKVTHTGTYALAISLRTHYRNCDLNKQNCGGWTYLHIDNGEEKILPALAVGRMYEFDVTGLLHIGEAHGKVTMDWRPWKLYRFVGGAKWIVNSYDCDITSGAKPKIRLVDYPAAAKLYRQGGEGTKWINYVNDWVYGPPTNVFTHPTHGQVYCTAAQIYDIVELRMSDGSLKKVDPEYSATLPSGERLSGLGTKLANVECCPNEPNCGDDFEYLPEPPEKECFTDAQCYNAGNPTPVDATHYVIYQCINNNCVKSAPILVECTTSAQCLEGQICDLSTMNYGQCITQIPGAICGDGTCDITESFETCPADCTEPEIECEWWEEEIPAGTVEDCGFLGWKKTVPFVSCEIKTYEAGCKVAPWIYIVGGIIVLILLIVLVLIVLRKKPNNKKWKKKK